MQISILLVQSVIVTVLSPAYFVMSDVSVAFYLLSAVTITLSLIMYRLMLRRQFGCATRNPS